MLKQETILATLNKLLNQSPKIRKGTDAVYFCPNCNHYKRKFEVNLDSGKYNCWVCGFRGLSFNSLCKQLKAPAEYYSTLKISPPKIASFNDTFKFEAIPESEKILSLPSEFKTLSIQSNDLDHRHAIKYLTSRNITKSDIIRYNIGYCDSGLYKGRVVIPSYDLDGKLNFFSARDYYNTSTMKYRLCDFSKDIIGFEMLINFDEEVTLVEGQFDAIAVRRNCIPLFGKTLSRKLKYQLLESRPPRVNVLLDNDAVKGALKICSFLLKNNINVYLVQLDGKDPSVLGFEKTWESIRRASPITFSSFITHTVTL